MPEGEKPTPKGPAAEADPFGAGAAPAPAKEDSKAAPGGVAEKPTTPAAGGLTGKSSVSGGLFSALKKPLLPTAAEHVIFPVLLPCRKYTLLLPDSYMVRTCRPYWPDTFCVRETRPPMDRDANSEVMIVPLADVFFS